MIISKIDINAAKNIHRQGLAITDVEMEALASGNTGETAVCEASKKKRNYSLKPLVLNQRYSTNSVS